MRLCYIQNKKPRNYFVNCILRPTTIPANHLFKIFSYQNQEIPNPEREKRKIFLHRTYSSYYYHDFFLTLDDDDTFSSFSSFGTKYPVSSSEKKVRLRRRFRFAALA